MGARSGCGTIYYLSFGDGGSNIRNAAMLSLLVVFAGSWATAQQLMDDQPIRSETASEQRQIWVETTASMS
jgi:hypothetical protein